MTPWDIHTPNFRGFSNAAFSFGRWTDVDLDEIEVEESSFHSKMKLSKYWILTLKLQNELIIVSINTIYFKFYLCIEPLVGYQVNSH